MKATFGLATLLTVLGVAFLWFWNVYKFVECDFEAPYKCEVLHFVGIVIPPVSIATVWYDGK